MILSSRLNDLEGFPVRYRSVLEEKFDIIEVDQYTALPSAYNQDIVGVLTYGNLAIRNPVRNWFLEDMEHFGDKEKNMKMFDEMPNLKVVSTVSAGFDHLDIEYLKVRKLFKVFLLK